MAEHFRSGAPPWVVLLLGALIVAVVAIGYLFYTGGGLVRPELPASINVTVDLPKVVPPIPDAPRLPDAPIPIPK